MDMVRTRLSFASSADSLVTAALSALTAFFVLLLKPLFLTLLISLCRALLRADLWFAKLGNPPGCLFRSQFPLTPGAEEFIIFTEPLF